ncbi:hypothetical protein J3Q64DRAFT_1819234 [Phycomyces blakesleeanus]|uniref:Uncharacterized protein n=1 Tax=Phycomyces blakesleeanus TaxID=4837 RepID=A0ABR3B6B1_PHYBL
MLVAHKSKIMLIVSESFTVFQAAKFQDNTHKLKVLMKKQYLIFFISFGMVLRRSIEGHDITQTNCQLIDLTSQLKATTLFGSFGGWYCLWVSWILQLRVSLFEYWHILFRIRILWCHVECYSYNIDIYQNEVLYVA